MAVALFLKGLARRISFHFNSVPVRQRACQAWSPAECRGTEEARRVAQHGRSRECFYHAVSLCVISVPVRIYRRPSCLFVNVIGVSFERLSYITSVIRSHMLAGSLHMGHGVLSVRTRLRRPNIRPHPRDQRTL